MDNLVDVEPSVVMDIFEIFGTSLRSIVFLRCEQRLQGLFYVVLVVEGLARFGTINMDHT
jgi:hypothetical protein